MSQPSRVPSDIYPSLVYDDAPAAIDWLTRTCGFTLRFTVPGPGNRIEHSELSFGASVVMISSPKSEEGLVSPKTLKGVSHGLSVYVEDPDAHHALAVAAGTGVNVVRPLQTEEYGARGYMMLDPEGHRWYFGNYRPGEYWQTNNID